MEIFLCILCCLYILLLIPTCLCYYYLLLSIKRGEMYMLMQNMMESLRPLVGSKGWDFCVLWKLSEDQRFVEWMNCCCGGAETTQEANNNNNCGEQELLFPISALIPCRDTMFQHPRTNSCDLLLQLPTSIPLDSGIYAQTLISNLPSWLNSSSVTGSHFLEECSGTRVLIPLAGGLVELFVNKQIPEDPNVIDFVTSQCNIPPPLDHHQNDTTTSFIIEMNDQIIQLSRPFIMNDESDKTVDPTTATNPPVSPATAFEGLNLSPYDIPVQFGARNDASFNLDGDERDDVESKVARRSGHELSNSVSDCSDQIDEEDNEGNVHQGIRKSSSLNVHHRSLKSSSGKGPQSKNLVAERKRRKKLNERLYTLRSLVPNISKLDRASILGDAIEYVKDLKRQEKELQDELEEHSENDGTYEKRHSPTSEILNFRVDSEFPNIFSFETSGSNEITTLRQNLDSDTSANEKAPQMEPQVEVAQIDGNDFYVKVFCEHKPGRFVRLLEALNSLALEVTNANVTTFRNLVSNVLKVEKKDSKMVVQADNLRDILLEFTRNPSRVLCDMSKPPENGNGSLIDYQQNLHHNHHHQQTY